MKALFLIFTFIPLILTVNAQRQFNQYTCQAFHKHAQTAFYLELGREREILINGQLLLPSIKRINDMIEVSLTRIVTVLDATYRKNAHRTFPLNTRTLPIQLEHSFGGVNDVFNMTCYPRDP